MFVWQTFLRGAAPQVKPVIEVFKEEVQVKKKERKRKKRSNLPLGLTLFSRSPSQSVSVALLQPFSNQISSTLKPRMCAKESAVGL